MPVSPSADVGGTGSRGAEDSEIYRLAANTDAAAAEVVPALVPIVASPLCEGFTRALDSGSVLLNDAPHAVEIGQLSGPQPFIGFHVSLAEK